VTWRTGWMIGPTTLSGRSQTTSSDREVDTGTAKGTVGTSTVDVRKPSERKP